MNAQHLAWFSQTGFSFQQLCSTQWSPENDSTLIQIEEKIIRIWASRLCWKKQKQKNKQETNIASVVIETHLWNLKLVSLKISTHKINPQLIKTSNANVFIQYYHTLLGHFYYISTLKNVWWYKFTTSLSFDMWTLILMTTTSTFTLFMRTQKYRRR